MLFGGFFGMPAALVAMALHLGRTAKREPFPQEEGVQAVGPLLDRMTTDIFSVTELRFRLTAVLPLLKTKDASLLEPRHYELLNATLHKHVTSSFPWQPWEKVCLLAVLDAYSRIGDIRAIRDVARIAQGKVPSGLRDAEVRAAAQRCLIHLKQEEQAVRQQETLLRSSERPEGRETLLRPVVFVPEADPTQLLRPVDQDETD